MIRKLSFLRSRPSRDLLTLAALVSSLAGTMAAPIAAQDGDARGIELAELLGKSSGLDFRMVGPHRGGRVTAVTGVIQQRSTFYMGPSGGGVWKTTDAGATWRAVTDGFLDTGSVGAIDVADSDPNVVYVGTGSACIRSNVVTGRGVWRSTDAAATWSFLGLRDSGPDRRPGGASQGSRPGLRRGARSPVRLESRTRRLSQPRRRRHLAAGAVRVGAHRRGRSGNGSVQPAADLCRRLDRRAQAVDDPLGLGGERPLPLDRRRR